MEILDLQDIKNILLAKGLDPAIPIHFNDYKAQEEGVLILFDTFNEDGKGDTNEDTILITLRYKDNYKKAFQVFKQLKTILKEGNIVNYRHNTILIQRYQSQTSLYLGRVEEGYHVFVIQTILTYTY